MITYCVRFFPAAGRRHCETGIPFNRNNTGYYWSSSAVNTTIIWLLCYNHGSSYLDTGSAGLRTSGLAIRCVA